MMTREQLFEHLMKTDPDFRKEVVTSATVAGMDLYQAALSMLNKDEKNDALANVTGRVIDAEEADQLRSRNGKGKSAKAPSAKAKAAKAREKGKTTEMRVKQRKDNERIRAALVKILTANGPMILKDMKAKLHPRTSALVVNEQQLHNQMYALKQAKQIRWTKGAKRPNVTWEIVP